MRYCCTLFLLVLFSACRAPQEVEIAAKSSTPNIIFILADDMGWGDPQSYNPGSRIPTPYLDQLTAQGMRFTDAHTPSAVCTPTRYGLLTGRYAWRSPLQSGVLFGYDPPLIEQGRMTLADLLRQNGYYTAVVGKWHLGLPWQMKDSAAHFAINRPVITRLAGRDEVELGQPLGKGGPPELGFDYSYVLPASLDIAPYCYIENGQPEAFPLDSVRAETRSPHYDKGFWRSGPASPGFDHRQVLPTLTDKAVSFLKKHHERRNDQPFFLYFPLTSPHTPWLPTEKFRGTSKAGKYGDFVAMSDHSLGRIMSVLDTMGYTDNTLLIFSSDNGSHTDFIDSTYQHRANAYWRGQKADIHEGGHRVPFIARWPGQIPAGSVSEQMICLTDMMATIAEITGTEMPQDVAEDSYNLLPALLDKNFEEPIRPHLVSHSLDGMFAIREGNWKLIKQQGSGGFTSPRRVDTPGGQLYDLRADPAEQQNLYHQHPEIVARLKARLDNIRKRSSNIVLQNDKHP
jgi:arylsulfatase A-like enzyme